MNDEVPKEALIIAQTSCIESSHQRNKDKNDKHENLNGKKINRYLITAVHGTVTSEMMS